MKIVRRIITIAILFTLILIPNAYAQSPTSTPETIESFDYNFIDNIKDALSGSSEQLPTTTVVESDNSQSASAASSGMTIITWTGNGADNLASTAANWSGNVAPRSGDGVVFDNTSSKNCTWDLPVTLASYLITAGYTGKVILEADLVISDAFIWTGGGEDNLASNPANWSKSAVPEDGDRVVFSGAYPTDCDWNIDMSPSSFIMETAYSGVVTLSTNISLSEYLNISGGTFNLNGFGLTVNGYLLIGPGATLNAHTSTITVRGDWFNAGTFNCGQSTVVLSGTGQTIYGDNTFYNLIKTVISADTLYFQAGSTQTILNILILSGAEDNLLSLYSTEAGTYWFVNAQGAVNILFARIKDMNNDNPVNIVPMNSLDEGHNDGVTFSGSECAYNSPVPLWEGIERVVIPLFGKEGQGEIFYNDREGAC